jgi:hypothetical protein
MHKLLASTALFLLLASIARAQTTDLSGVWKLNQGKSFLGGDHPPAAYQLVLTLKVQASSIFEIIEAKNPGAAVFGLPKSKSSLDLAIDGKEHEVLQPGFMPTMPPNRLKVIAAWEGSTLVITERGAGFGGSMTTTSRFFLSQDQTQLVELVETHNVFADIQQRRVYEKMQ